MKNISKERLEQRINEELGKGTGVGGNRQRIGGANICVCPKCKKEIPHQRGVPCQEIKCPDCKTLMIGKNE